MLLFKSGEKRTDVYEREVGIETHSHSVREGAKIRGASILFFIENKLGRVRKRFVENGDLILKRKPFCMEIGEEVVAEPPSAFAKTHVRPISKKSLKEKNK